MKIHHLNCGCMCPIGGALFDGFSKGLTAKLACHCLLLETEQGLVLIDTGFGVKDMERTTKRVSKFFANFNNIQFDRKYTAYDQIVARGFDPLDVRHIVLTHLDFDHAGGLEDFPNATVHVMQAEMDAARARRGFVANRRFEEKQWNDVKKWQFYNRDGGEWYGFDSVRDLHGLPPDILMIPLPGHTMGHAGIAINTGTDWLLHAGDAYFYRDEMHQPKRHCTPGLRFYQTLMEENRPLRLHNQQRLRDLSVAKGSEIRFLCSHDAQEFEHYAGHPAC